MEIDVLCRWVVAIDFFFRDYESVSPVSTVYSSQDSICFFCRDSLLKQYPKFWVTMCADDNSSFSTYRQKNPHTDTKIGVWSREKHLSKVSARVPQFLTDV